MNKTSIEWTEFSSNPLYVVDRETGKRGWFCEKVSPGCAHCYASALNVRRGTGHAYLPENRDKVEWRLNEHELAAILRRRKPARIFMCDMLDLFHDDVPDAFIDRVFATMALSPHHTFQVLTKRPERMRAYVTALGAERSRMDAAIPLSMLDERDPCSAGWPLPNVWLGVSVENQRMADERIPVLLDTPAAVRFLSCEPLLGPLDLTPFLGDRCNVCDDPSQSEIVAIRSGISWVIVGGESGPGSAERKLVERCWHDFGIDDPDWCVPGRSAIDILVDEVPPPHQHGPRPPAGKLEREWVWHYCPKPQALEWVRSLRDQCAAVGVAFHFKGWGGRTATSGGRLLDGRTWDEMPEAASERLEVE